MSTNRRAAAYIEMHTGKQTKDEVIRKAVEMGMSDVEARTVLDEVIAKKSKTARLLIILGSIGTFLGVVVSIIATNSGSYEYFYWWGMVLLGVVLLITGIVLKAKLK